MKTNILFCSCLSECVGHRELKKDNLNFQFWYFSDKKYVILSLFSSLFANLYSESSFHSVSSATITNLVLNVCH